MKSFRRLFAVVAAVSLSACATSRTAFTPQSGPPTVGMPAEVSAKERLFIPDLENALRGDGYVTVRSGAGDYQLEFQIQEGPINTDTRIELLEGGKRVAIGNGRAAGAPLFGRSKVAEKSFSRAFEQFQSAMPRAARGGSRSYERQMPAQETPGGPEDYVY